MFREGDIVHIKGGTLAGRRGVFLHNVTSHMDLPHECALVVVRNRGSCTRVYIPFMHIELPVSARLVRLSELSDV